MFAPNVQARLRIAPDIAPPPTFVAAWRWWLPLALLSLVLALLFIDPFAGDWDALDYTTLALKGQPSSMVLGRSLFIYANHALWRGAHALCDLKAEQAYLLFKYAVVAQSPLAVVACWELARQLTADVRAATVAALLVALSPFYIMYSGQAMTEIPSIWLLAVALLIHLHGLRRKNFWLVLAGAALLGACVNVREAALLYAPWLVFAPFVCGWRLRRREIMLTVLACLTFTICAGGGFACWWLLDIGHYRKDWHGWVTATRLETARHPVSLANFGPLLRNFFITAPFALVAFPVAAYREWQLRRRVSPLLALALVGVGANLALIAHYSVVLNQRYLLTGLPGIAPLVAAYLMRVETNSRRDARRAFLAVTTGIFCVAVLVGQWVYYFQQPVSHTHTLTQEYRARLALVPRDAVLLAGSQTISVMFWRGVGAGDWETIGTGAGWPGAQLAPVIAAHLRAGQRVFLDADPRCWATDGWQLEETRALVALENQFRFRRLAQTIYEIRPSTDQMAHDPPHLRTLLPATDQAPLSAQR